MSGRALILLVVIVGALGLTNTVRPVNVLAYSLVATLLLSFLWSLTSVHGVTLRREPRESHLQVGETLFERLTLTNRSFLPHLWIEVADESTLPGHRAGRIISVGSLAVRTWVARTVCNRRGEFFVGPTTLVGADPLGLFVRRWTFGTAKRVLVYPQTVELPAFVLPATSQLGGTHRRGGPSQATPHAAEVREYHPGDPLNHIHWATTARNRQLMVKEFDRDPSADLWIFLDLEARAQRGEGDESTEEYAVKIAASIARLALEQHLSVGLVASGSRLMVLPADRGDRQLLKMLEALAVVRANGRTPLAEVLAAEGLSCGRNAVVMAITPSSDERWVGGLRELRLHGIGVAAVALEANTFGPEGPAQWSNGLSPDTLHDTSHDTPDSTVEASPQAVPGERNSLLLVGALAAADLPTYLVKRGDVLSEVLRGNGRRAMWGSAL